MIIEHFLVLHDVSLDISVGHLHENRSETTVIGTLTRFWFVSFPDSLLDVVDYIHIGGADLGQGVPNILDFVISVDRCSYYFIVLFIY